MYIQIREGINEHEGAKLECMEMDNEGFCLKNSRWCYAITDCKKRNQWKNLVKLKKANTMV